MNDDFTALCKRLEHFETPKWAVDAILLKEPLIGHAVDPCTGAGVIDLCMRDAGYDTTAYDIHDWGYPFTEVRDYLSLAACPDVRGGSVVMNPPFSKAVDFVEKSIDLGAVKILCFQRFAWWESLSRRSFWERHPPARVYICGERANCCRHDIPKDKRGSSSPTAHAWFVWENGQPDGTKLGHIWKDGKS